MGERGRNQCAIDAAQPPCFKRAMNDFPRLGQLRDRYDILYCDVWGVIRDGHALLPDAVAALQEFRRAGGAVCLVSNSPRRSPSLASMLAMSVISTTSPVEMATRLLVLLRISSIDIDSPTIRQFFHRDA